MFVVCDFFSNHCMLCMIIKYVCVTDCELLPFGSDGRCCNHRFYWFITSFDLLGAIIRLVDWC